ncbi:MAG: hypothetical protein M1834_009390 [Cirrosporium novae-zelandiae]|nr:MAG: hypothetical protein M1834_009390 [Cirrosporium novae-zelandiae]
MSSLDLEAHDKASMLADVMEPAGAMVSLPGASMITANPGIVGSDRVFSMGRSRPFSNPELVGKYKMPTPEVFDGMMATLVNKYGRRKSEKCFHSAKRHLLFLDILKPGQGKIPGVSPQEKHWVKTNFRDGRVGGVSRLRSIKKNWDVAIAENFYRMACYYHLLAGHGGRDAVWSNTDAHRWACFSKDLLVDFSMICPGCAETGNLRGRRGPRGPRGSRRAQPAASYAPPPGPVLGCSPPPGPAPQWQNVGTFFNRPQPTLLAPQPMFQQQNMGPPQGVGYNTDWSFEQANEQNPSLVVNSSFSSNSQIPEQHRPISYEVPLPERWKFAVIDGEMVLLPAG